MNNSALHTRSSPFATAIPTSEVISASPSGPGPPDFIAPVTLTNLGMNINCQGSKRMRMNHDMHQDRLEISPPSPNLPASSLSLTSPSTADAQILSPATIFQSMEHGSVDGLTPEGLNSLKNLNFSTATEEGDDYVYARKQKTPRDPMSHRIIEKRRRDRMNNCLADLSRLIPSHFIKQGQGRIEKTEIIEMAIKHLKHLHSILPKEETNSSEIELSKTQIDDDKQKAERFLMGYKECGTELMRFLMDQEGLTTKDRLFIRVVNHLAEREMNIKVKAVSPEFLKTLDQPSSGVANSTQAHMTASNLASSVASALAAPTAAPPADASSLPDIKQLAKDPSETASTNGDLQASDETCSALSGSGSSQTKKASTRSVSSGYASAYNACTNRSLREELGLSEAELEEERNKSQHTTMTKGKNIDRTDSISVGVTESSLRDLLSNPEPLIPLYNYDAGDAARTNSNAHNAAAHNAASSSAASSSAASSVVPPSTKRSKDDAERREDAESIVGEDSTTADVSQSQFPLCSGQAEADAKTTDSSSSIFHYKKDLKLRFSNEGEEHNQGCPNHSHKSPNASSHTHSSHSNRMRGHNSKDSKDKIMEGYIKMKRKQEQEEKTEEGGHSSPSSPSPPETSSSCSDKTNPSASPMGIPCFALHPSGTFYVPIAIHPSLIQHTLEKKFTSRAPCPTLCHPVSIPVNFMATDNAGASHSLHNINVGANTKNSHNQFNSHP